MQPDQELETWRRQWQAPEAIPVELRRRVERQIRSRRLELWGALSVTVTYGVGVPVWAILSGRADLVVLAAAVWVFIAISWGVSWSLARGLSKPVAITTAAFLEYSIRTCESRRQGITAACILYVVISVFDLAWIYQSRPEPHGIGAFLTSPRLLVFHIVTAALAVLAVRTRRRLARERRNLLDLRRQLEGPGP